MYVTICEQNILHHIKVIVLFHLLRRWFLSQVGDYFAGYVFVSRTWLACRPVCARGWGKMHRIKWPFTSYLSNPIRLQSPEGSAPRRLSAHKVFTGLFFFGTGQHPYVFTFLPLFLPFCPLMCFSSTSVQSFSSNGQCQTYGTVSDPGPGSRHPFRFFVIDLSTCQDPFGWEDVDFIGSYYLFCQLWNAAQGGGWAADTVKNLKNRINLFPRGTPRCVRVWCPPRVWCYHSLLMFIYRLFLYVCTRTFFFVVFSRLHRGAYVCIRYFISIILCVINFLFCTVHFVFVDVVWSAFSSSSTGMSRTVPGRASGCVFVPSVWAVASVHLVTPGTVKRQFSANKLYTTATKY